MSDRLSNEKILTAWETGAHRGPVDRALVLLWAGQTETIVDPADLPLGIRDQQLLKLRAETFGDMLRCVTACPSCDETLEFDLSSRFLMEGIPDRVDDSVRIGGREFQLRPLNSRDLADASNCADLEDAADLLRHRICGCRRGDIPTSIISELDSHIEAHEATTELTLSLTCIECSHRWSELVDIGSFFWSELEARAMRIFSEISEIARAYGWREKDILNLSAPRRQIYLTLARGG